MQDELSKIKKRKETNGGPASSLFKKSKSLSNAKGYPLETCSAVKNTRVPREQETQLIFQPHQRIQPRHILHPVEDTYAHRSTPACCTKRRYGTS